MKVTLLHYTPLKVCSHAIRTCWQSFNKGDSGGTKDTELIERVGNKLKHKSTLEHLVFTFYIQGISRACLQELARHRVASLSVKSTRYTLKEIKSINNLSKYLRTSGDNKTDKLALESLTKLKDRLILGDVNLDEAKYALPEAYLTELTYTINARSLQNFLELRSSKSALKEIRELAYKIYEAIPDTHKFIFKGFLNE